MSTTYLPVMPSPLSALRTSSPKTASVTTGSSAASMKNPLSVPVIQRLLSGTNRSTSNTVQMPAASTSSGANAW